MKHSGKNRYRAVWFMVFVCCCVQTVDGAVIDHTCTTISAIPGEWINQAKSQFRIGYSHSSHGSQLVTGMETWRNTGNAAYDYTYSDYGFATGVFMADYWACDTGVDPCDLGYSGFLGWRDATRQMLNAPGNDRNVVMWSWCGGVSENDAAGIDAYLTAMNGLEQEFPSVRFIYMTGHLDGSGEEGTLNQMNNRIRDYCRTNNKILFDFADMESYDPDGNYYLNRYADDGCYYDDGNWAEEWCDAHPGNVYCTSCDCQHSVPLNCNRKGAAFWWMMALMAGWQSGPAPTPTPTPDDPTATPGNPTATPGPAPDMTMDLTLADAELTEGDDFFLHLSVTNNEMNPHTIDVYIVLDVLGSYWFWPSWEDPAQGLDHKTMTVGSLDLYQEAILDFTWPGGTGALGGLQFIGCMFTQGTWALVGDVSVIPWRYF